VNERTSSDPVVSHIEQRIVAGTDGASFYLYHPADLQHRLTSPLAWPCYHFACRPEFEAGRLVGFDTGGDGGYAFRITSGELTERERAWSAGSWEFRYVVRHGRVYLDGGYALPSDDYFDESEEHPDQWITVPNGCYCVRVSAIEWFSEPGAINDQGEATGTALPSYVIQFLPTDTLEAIPVASTPPRMEPSRSAPPTASSSFAEYDTYDEEPIDLDDIYVIQTTPDEAPIPGFHLTVEAPDEFYQAVYGSVGNQILPDRIERLVIAPGDETPCLGIVALPSGASRRGAGPWKMTFHGRRLVTVLSRTATSPWPTAQVAAFHRPASKVSAERLHTVKRAFADFATRNATYRTTVRNPDFEAERVAAMECPTSLTHLLIHHLPLPLATRLELLVLSDADRLNQLERLLLEAD